MYIPPPSVHPTAPLTELSPGRARSSEDSPERYTLFYPLPSTMLHRHSNNYAARECSHPSSSSPSPPCKALHLTPHPSTPDRSKRVKDAKNEAQKEIEEYRSQKDAEFKEFEKKVCIPPQKPPRLLSNLLPSIYTSAHSLISPVS